METTTITLFKGFTKPAGDVDLLQTLEEIKSWKNASAVEKIRTLTAQGEATQAARIKKQLPAVTFSATYRNQRVAACITGYNDLLVLDFDHIAAPRIASCKEAIAGHADTLFCFLSPSGNGLKAGVRMQGPAAAELRWQLLDKEEIGYAQLDLYHKAQFELARAQYEKITGASVDPSGSDVGRLCFLSYDPEVYINRQALEELKKLSLRITAPAPQEPARKKTLLRQEMPGNPEADCQGIATHVQAEFQKCVRSVMRGIKYEPGGRNTFLFALGGRCYRKELPVKDVIRLAEKEFGAPDMDVAEPIGNAYKYTDKTDRREEEKKKLPLLRIIETTSQLYQIRRNVVSQRLEYRRADTQTPFVPMRKHDFNTIFVALQKEGVNCMPSIVRSVVDSDYAPCFNPFEDYFCSLPPWDGKTDYIGHLAATIRTGCPGVWEDYLRRWLVGMVACALDDNVVNQLALTITGEQAKGKSTWIRNLLPPQLKHYYRNGMIDPRNKDHLLQLSQCLLVNLEEFEGMTRKTVGELKRMITQDYVNERKAYEGDTDFFIRRASFIASTNDSRFLQDTTGTRRFPTITALDIDYKTPVPHEGIYAQALALWKSGYRYWYEGEEIKSINEHNSRYTLTPAEEELFFVYYRTPTDADLAIKWLPVSAIMAHLAYYGKLLPGDHCMRTLSQVLDKHGFARRRNEYGIYEYQVVEMMMDEVERRGKEIRN